MSQLQLQDKVILITGALGQAGRSAVPLFLSKGAIVVACDIRSIEEVPQVAGLREQYGSDRFVFLQADCNDEQQVIGVMNEIDRRFGRLDGLYHNTYTNVWKPALELSLDEWNASITGCLTSTFLTNKYALPLMIKAGGGSIVNTSSILSQIPQRGCLAYGAAKAGINQFTRVLAVDYAKHNIRANCVVPGDFKADEVVAKQSEEAKESIRRVTLKGRTGSPNEINEVAAFLLSDAASYVTASLYNVDGGYRLI